MQLFVTSTDVCQLQASRLQFEPPEQDVMKFGKGHSAVARVSWVADTYPFTWPSQRSGLIRLRNIQDTSELVRLQLLSVLCLWLLGLQEMKMWVGSVGWLATQTASFKSTAWNVRLAGAEPHQLGGE